MKSRKLMGLMGLLTSASLVLAGCGSAAQQNADTSDDGKLMTVDVFDSRANYQGIQKGWFGKIVKDKFNIKLNIIAPNVAGGGDTLFDTRSAAGNLGDIVITTTGGGRMKKLVKAGLVADMTPYMKGMTYLNKFKGSADALAKLVGKKGVWGYGMNVSTQPATEPSEGPEPAAAPYIRWDYYKEIGYPAIDNLDDFIDVLKQMQDRARQDTGQNDIYAISLFKDWDWSFLSNAGHIAAWFGYANQGSAFIKADGTDKQTVLTKDGIYQQVLKFLQRANEAGIVDPESATQSWDKISTKVIDGKVLMSIWSWLGKPRMNSVKNKEKGIGFMLAPVKTIKVYSAGFTPDGDINTAISLGAKAKNKQRLVKFINWLYSPEGTYAIGLNATSPACPKNLCWVVENGEQRLTEFGDKALFDSANLNVPEEWGGGSYNEGASQLNFPAVSPNDIDPATKQTYNPALWKSELEKKTALQDDWSAHMEGAKTDIEYLEKTGKLMVQPGVAYAAPQEKSAISAIRGQINTAVVASSWKAALAPSSAEFDKIIADMTEKANGLGFDKIQKVDYSALDEHAALSAKAAK